MLIAILSHTPSWVWGLFAALLALGLWQTRSRQVAPPRLLALPLALLALGLWTLAPTFAALPASVVPWLLAGTAGVAAGLRLRPRAGTHWLPRQHRLQLPGSWLPLLLIVAIFTLRYALTVGMVLNPALRNDPEVPLTSAALFGALGGVFLGRAVGLLRLTRGTIDANATAAA